MNSPSPKIPEGLQAFLAHAESLHPSSNEKRENGFAKEFQQLKALSSQLKKNPEYSSRHGEMECNRPKNRYKDILPFDHNRIILPTLPGIPGSDYINGNYVKGPDGSAAYLAVQGPLPRTVDDFWRLIASHRCQVVIMVCREVEMGKLKCKRYWPESKDEKLNFAGLDISLISEDPIADGFVMRTMKMKSGKEEMTVTQLQYTAWPDHDVPKSAAPLIEMNKTLRALQTNKQQQILIHCSAGCGRTGTICAVDYAWTLLKMQKTKDFSVYDIVADLRRQRMAMVQTKEQYTLVYKAVLQLVNEELEKEKFKFHTYVNVDLPTSPKSPPEQPNYENCEFIKSIVRWKQSDMQNGAVPRAPLSLPLPVPTERKSHSTPPSGNTTSPTSPEGMLAKSSASKTNKDYVNVDFGNKNDLGDTFAAGGPENKAATSVKLALPDRDYNKQVVNSNAIKGGVQTPSTGQQESPTYSNYEVLPRTASSPAAVNHAGKDASTQKNKGLLSDYEIPPLATHGDKKQTRHVPEGLLIDLGDDVPPLPDKRHSLGSSRYENIEVKPPSLPGISSQRASSSPNVQDDMFLSGDSPFQPRVMQPQNSANSKAFHTVPNRLRPASGPKRCPLTADAFEDPHASGKSGFKVMHSPTEASGQYSLVGAVSPPTPSPPKVALKPSFPAQTSMGAGLQMTKPSDRGHHSSSPPKKQGEKTKAHTPVGAYSLVGIPEAGGQTPVHVEHVSTKQKTDPRKENTGNPVEVKGTAIVEPSYELVEQRQQQPTNKVSHSPPVVPAYTPKTAGIPDKEANKDIKGALHNSPVFPSKVDKSDTIPDVFVRGHGDGAEVATDDAAITDVYATIGPRDNKGSNSPSLTAKSASSSPKLRNQTSSSSLRSYTSTSSDELEGDAPPIPEKTNEAFLSPGAEPYENVQQQSSKGTLDRFRKMMKTGAKVNKASLPKRLSDVTSPLGLPRSSSSGSGVTLRLDDLGFKKQVARPKGPRSCPKHWPSF